jgi:hypothetical protein
LLDVSLSQEVVHGGPQKHITSLNMHGFPDEPRRLITEEIEIASSGNRSTRLRASIESSKNPFDRKPKNLLEARRYPVSQVSSPRSESKL